VGACSGSSPSTPSPTPQPVPTPTPTPTPTPNAAPTIKSFTSNSPRVEADEEVTLTAVVEDAETPVDQLTYEWSAKPVNGSFTGTGRQVKWKSPHLQNTPDVYTITLTVTENYAQNGQSQQNKTSASVDVRYNDSYREMTTLGMRFLTKLFPDFSVSADQAVQDFSDNCSGKAAEHADVANNRLNFHILSGTYSISSIDLNSDKTQGRTDGTCVFHDIPKSTGKEEVVTGTCQLTFVYEKWQWYLCTSGYTGVSVGPAAIMRPFARP